MPMKYISGRCIQRESGKGGEKKITEGKDVKIGKNMGEMGRKR